MAPGDTGSKSKPGSGSRRTGAQVDPRHRLQVSVCDAQGRSLRRAALAAWLARVAPARLRGLVTIAFVGDARMRTLNRTWRGVDKATDVLSFPTEAQSAGAQERRSAGELRHVGDIVIATGVAARQAREAGHDESTEHRVLALHGLLHLAGYDHERDAGEMARVEARLRKRGGLSAGLIERAPVAFSRATRKRA
jgi:probable rRNA maturation factor